MDWKKLGGSVGNKCDNSAVVMNLPEGYYIPFVCTCILVYFSSLLLFPSYEGVPCDKWMKYHPRDSGRETAICSGY